MWEKVKMLTACVCAAAWWSVFYPELCFTEETCQVIRNAGTENEAANIGAGQDGKEDKDGQGALTQGIKTDPAAGILRAGDDEVVISSRFLEWCEENFLTGKE